MIKFQKDGKTLFTEMDNGELNVQDQKLAESFKEDGINIKEDKSKEANK